MEQFTFEDEEFREETLDQVELTDEIKGKRNKLSNSITASITKL
jgi:hypothetical protein